MKIRDIPRDFARSRWRDWDVTNRPNCLSNDFQAPARELITRYVKRNGVEDALGISVNFFHVNCLASEVRLNVDLDLALTVIAHGCYRWLATQLPGYDKSKPKQEYRRFVATGGVVEIQSDRLVVRFDKPRITRSSARRRLDRDCPPIPWLGGLKVAFEYP